MAAFRSGCHRSQSFVQFEPAGSTPAPMAPKINTNTSIVCAEDISLLSLLHSVPTPPSRNLLEVQPHHKQGYTLSLNEERQLVDALAFLANDQEDTNHIPALCVQEKLKPPSLNILLAVNRTGWQDGDQNLRRLIEGFDVISALLANREQGECI